MLDTYTYVRIIAVDYCDYVLKKEKYMKGIWAWEQFDFFITTMTIAVIMQVSFGL